MLAAAQVAMLVGSWALGAGPSTQVLFTLGRSTNANILEYAAEISDDGWLDRRRPFDVSWRMLAQDGHREGLSFFERQFAYGVSSRPLVERRSYVLKLVSCADRQITVVKTEAGFEAQLALGGIPSRLNHIFVRLAEGGMSPVVLSVELSGQSLRDGRPTFERILPPPPES